MDEFILNPKSLQISCLILKHSSRVIAAGGGAMTFHSSFVPVFVHEDQESKRFFNVDLLFTCNKQKLLLLQHIHTSADQHLAKARFTRSQTSLCSLLCGIFSFFLINNTVFSTFSLISPLSDLPSMCCKMQTHATSRAGFWV